MDDSKVCFVISPIGDTGSPIRIRSDKILQYVIRPALQPSGYRALRADELPEPGLITHNVIRHLLRDPLVIADLTGQNANVFYELAVRHATGKPYLQIMEEGERIPFDVAAIRTVTIDHRDIASVDRAIKELQTLIASFEATTSIIESPISISDGLAYLQPYADEDIKSQNDVYSLFSEVQLVLESVLERLGAPEKLFPEEYLLKVINKRASSIGRPGTEWHVILSELDNLVECALSEGLALNDETDFLRKLQNVKQLIQDRVESIQ